MPMMSQEDRNRSQIAYLASIAANLSEEHEKLSENVDRVIEDSQGLRKQLLYYTGELRYFSRRLAEESDRMVEDERRRNAEAK